MSLSVLLLLLLFSGHHLTVTFHKTNEERSYCPFISVNKLHFHQIKIIFAKDSGKFIESH